MGRHPAQQQAAEVLVAYGQNGRFTECVVAHGFPDRVWQDSIDPVSWVDPLLATPWGAEQAPVDFAAEQVAAAWGMRFEYWANHPDSAPGESAAELECRAGDPGIDDEQISAINAPDPYDSVLEDWGVMLQEVGRDVAPFRIWTRCLGRSTLATELGVDSWRQLFRRLDESLNPNDVPLGDEPETEAWREFLQLQADFNDADWACRESHHDKTLELLGPKLAEFEDDHHEAIEELEAHWAEVEREARDLGWTPEAPTMGVTLDRIPD